MSPAGWLLSLALVVVAGLAAAVARLLASRRRLAVDLVTTRRRFSESMNLAPFCAYMKDPDGRYLYVNPTFITVARKDQPQIPSFIGRTDHEVFPTADAQVYVDDDREVLRKGTPIAFDNSSIGADGIVRQWFSVKFPWTDEQGRTCVAGISFDMSEVQRARAAVRASEERCALALEAGRMGTFTMDLATQTLDTSPLFATLNGRPASKIHLSLEESLAEVHPDDRLRIVEAVQAALRDSAPNRITYRVMLPDGTIRWVELMGRVFTDEAGRPTVVHGVGFDVTEERTAFDELARRKATLRRLIDVQENERQTLCHELHDGLIQYAIGAKMQLEGARDEQDAAVRAARIDAAVDCLERGIAEGRQVIRGLRPAVLDDLGLAAAIEDLAEQMAAAGVTVHTDLDAGIDALPPALCTTIYRVVQESLTNARKHAGTDRATVEVRRGADDVQVRVRDHGSGFDVEEARTRGFGLVGMTERVRLAGGTCRIESRPGSGTEVNVRVPVPTVSGQAPTAGGGASAYAAVPDFAAR